MSRDGESARPLSSAFKTLHPVLELSTEKDKNLKQLLPFPEVTSRPSTEKANSSDPP